MAMTKPNSGGAEAVEPRRSSIRSHMGSLDEGAARESPTWAANG